MTLLLRRVPAGFREKYMWVDTVAADSLHSLCRQVIRRNGMYHVDKRAIVSNDEGFQLFRSSRSGEMTQNANTISYFFKTIQHVKDQVLHWRLGSGDLVRNHLKIMFKLKPWTYSVNTETDKYKLRHNV